MSHHHLCFITTIVLLSCACGVCGLGGNQMFGYYYPTLTRFNKNDTRWEFRRPAHQMSTSVAHIYDGQPWQPLELRCMGLGLTFVGRGPAEFPYGDYYTDVWQWLWEPSLEALASMGVNCVRIWSWNAQDENAHRRFLNKLFDLHMFVIVPFVMGVPDGLGSITYSDIDKDETRNLAKKDFRRLVRLNSQHPAVIGFFMGNELEKTKFKDLLPELMTLGNDFMKIIERVDDAIGFQEHCTDHETLGKCQHLFSIPLTAGEFDTIYKRFYTTVALDFWTVQPYDDGPALENMIASYNSFVSASGRPFRPILLGERGYSSTQLRTVGDVPYDASFSQANYIEESWNIVKAHIQRNSTLLGMCVFEFIDEWWKDDVHGIPLEGCPDTNKSRQVVCGNRFDNGLVIIESHLGVFTQDYSAPLAEGFINTQTLVFRPKEAAHRIAKLWKCPGRTRTATIDTSPPAFLSSNSTPEGDLFCTAPTIRASWNSPTRFPGPAMVLGPVITALLLVFCSVAVRYGRKRDREALDEDEETKDGLDDKKRRQQQEPSESDAHRKRFKLLLTLEGLPTDDAIFSFPQTQNVRGIATHLSTLFRIPEEQRIMTRLVVKIALELQEMLVPGGGGKAPDAASRRSYVLSDKSQKRILNKQDAVLRAIRWLYLRQCSGYLNAKHDDEAKALREEEHIRHDEDPLLLLRQLVLFDLLSPKVGTMRHAPSWTWNEFDKISRALHLQCCVGKKEENHDDNQPTASAACTPVTGAAAYRNAIDAAIDAYQLLASNGSSIENYEHQALLALRHRTATNGKEEEELSTDRQQHQPSFAERGGFSCILVNYSFVLRYELFIWVFAVAVQAPSQGAVVSTFTAWWILGVADNILQLFTFAAELHLLWGTFHSHRFFFISVMVQMIVHAVLAVVIGAYKSVVVISMTAFDGRWDVGIAHFYLAATLLFTLLKEGRRWAFVEGRGEHGLHSNSPSAARVMRYARRLGGLLTLVLSVAGAGITIIFLAKGGNQNADLTYPVWEFFMPLWIATAVILFLNVVTYVITLVMFRRAKKRERETVDGNRIQKKE